MSLLEYNIATIQNHNIQHPPLSTSQTGDLISTHHSGSCSFCPSPQKPRAEGDLHHVPDTQQHVQPSKQGWTHPGPIYSSAMGYKITYELHWTVLKALDCDWLAFPVSGHLIIVDQEIKCKCLMSNSPCRERTWWGGNLKIKSPHTAEKGEVE